MRQASTELFACSGFLGTSCVCVLADSDSKKVPLGNIHEGGRCADLYMSFSSAVTAIIIVTTKNVFAEVH